jgi:hypothetical protein
MLDVDMPHRQMTTELDFTSALEATVAEQLKAQRVGYLLGAGSSHLDNAGYPLDFELWDLIKDGIANTQKRADIQAKLDGGATGKFGLGDQLVIVTVYANES